MKVLYKIYACCIATPLFILATVIVSLIVAIAAILGDSKYLGYYVPKAWGHFTCWIYFLKVEVKGREYIDKNQSYVFLANHQGYLDILLVYGYLGHNFKWMMKKSLRKVPMLGLACEKTDHVFVDRTTPQKDILRKSLNILKSGKSMAIFAEGTRSDNGKLGVFKKGAFVVANMAQKSIIPISIQGAYDILPKGCWCAHWSPVTLTFHEPIECKGRDSENVEYLMRETRAAIAKTLGEE